MTLTTAQTIQKSSRAVSSTGTIWAKNKDGKSVQTSDPRPMPLLDSIVGKGLAAKWNLFNFRINEAFTDGDFGIDEELLSTVVDDRSIAWVNKGLTAVDLYNNDGEKIVWQTGRFGQFGYSASSKLGKRLSALAWQTDLWLKGVKVRILNFDEEYAEHDPNVITIYFTSNEGAEADGISYIRPSLVKKMVKGANRENKRFYRKAKQFNGRLITPWGLIKGNFDVAKSDKALVADIVTSEIHNLKTELWSTDDLAYFVMYPEPHNWFGRVFLDRQTRIHFWNWLITHEMLANWYREWLIRTLLEIRSGKVPNWAADFRRPLEADEEGTVATYNDRFIKWRDSGVSTLESPAMILALAKHAEMMLNPSSREDDSLKLPVEYAVRVRLSSMYDVYMRGYENEIPMIERGEIYIHKHFGLIVNDDEYERVALILGGGDKDDHVVVHFRLDLLTNTMYGICIRNPIGVSFDTHGELGVEYWVARIVNGEELIEEHYGDNAVVPSIDLEAGPMIIDNGDYDQSHLISDMTVGIDDSSFDKEFVCKLAVGAGKAMMVYGGHSNRMAFASMYRDNIRLSFHGHEEGWVDPTQMVPVQEDVNMIQGLDQAHCDQIVLALIEMGKQGIYVDEADFERVSKVLIKRAKKLNVRLPKTVKAGSTTELAVMHKKGIAYLRSEVRKLVMYIVETKQTEAYIEPTVKFKGTNKPYIYGAVDFMATEMGATTGGQYEIVGDEIAKKLDNCSQEQVFLLIKESLSFIYHKAMRGHENAVEIQKMFTRTDSGLLSGGILDYYLDYLVEMDAAELERDL